MAEPTLPQDDQQPALFGPQEAPDSAPTEDDPRIHEPLTAREKDMLMLEQYWWKHRGAKEQAIRDRWDISAPRYYQLQNRIIDKEAALVKSLGVV